MARRFCSAARHILFTSLTWGLGSLRARSTIQSEGQARPLCITYSPPPSSQSPYNFERRPLGTKTKLPPAHCGGTEPWACAVQTRLNSGRAQVPTSLGAPMTVAREPQAGPRRKAESGVAQEKGNFILPRKYTNRVKQQHAGHMPCPKQGSEMRPGLTRAWEQLMRLPMALGGEPGRARGGILFC